MKMKYVGALVVGIMAVGSLTVMAKDMPRMERMNTTSIEKISSDQYDYMRDMMNQRAEKLSTGSIEETPYDEYDYMRDMMDEQVEKGNLTREQADEMIDYCRTQMRQGSRSSSRSGRCH